MPEVSKDITNIDKIAPTVTEVVGNISNWSKWDVSININNAIDSESGLAEKPYSFDGGATWQNENYKIYPQNTSNIIVKVKDKVGNVYTHDTIDIIYIDKTAPSIATSISITSSLNSITVKANGSIDNESGLAGYKYSLDGNTWTDIISIEESHVFDSIKSNTEIKVYTIAVDNVGNESAVYGPISSTTSALTDKVQIKLSTEEWTQGPISVELSYNDIPSGYEIQNRYGSINWTTGTKIEEISENITIYARLYNKTLQDEIATNTKDVTKIDTTKPTISDVIGNPTSWIKDDVTLTIDGVEDNSGVLADKPYSFDNGKTWQELNSKTYTENESGIVIQVKDKAGNVYTHKVIDITYIDKTEPKIISVTEDPTTWTKDNITLTINGAEDNSGALSDLPYSFDNGKTWQELNTKTYTENTSDIIIKVRDSVGNIYTHAPTDVTKIDKEPPEVIEVTGNPTTWTKNNVTLTIEGAKDTAAGLHTTETYSFDGGATWQTSNVSEEYTDNTSGIVIKVKDAVGNIYTHDTIDIIYIDNTAPSKPTGIAVTTGLNTVTVEASGSTDSGIGLDGYKYSLDNSNWSDLISDGQTYTFDSIKAGTTVEVYAKAVDKLGWESSVYGPVSGTTSSVTNKVQITLNEDDWTPGPITADLSYDNIPEGYVIQYKIGTGSWKTGTKTTDITSNTTVYGRLYNEELGDEGAVNSKDVTNIDNTPPEIENVEGNPTTWVNSNVTLKVNGASDDLSGLHSTETYSFDNGSTWQTDNTKTYSSNTSNIIIKVKDKAGNIYTHSTINITKIDKEPPEGITVTGNPVTWVNSDVTLKVNGADDAKSGLHSTEIYSFDGGSTWQTDNTKKYTENTSNIVIKVKDAVGNIYTHSTINITYIDKTAPSKPTAISVTPGLNTLTVKASGSTDTGSGVVSYKYKLGANGTWTGEIDKDTAYTFDSIKAGTTVAVYAKAIDDLGWESSEFGPVNGTTSTVTNKVQIALSYDDWTKGLITAILSYDNVPTGYVIQYKIGTGSWITGTKTTNISSNTTVYGRLYNADLEDEIATNSKSVSKIDNEPPTDPTDIEVITRNQTSIVVKASGSTDSGCGLAGYQYSIDGSNWSSTVANGTNHTISSLSVNKTYTVYVRAIDDLDNISENNYTESASTLSTYSVTYNKNTTDTVSNLPTTQTKVEDITLTLSSKIPTRVGYTFKGWKTSSSVEYAAGDTYTSNSALTLYAIWELNAPVVTVTASNTDINLFDDVTTTFIANVGSTKEQSYQWYYNNTEIPGATNSTYSIATDEMTSSNYNGGTYKVVVTNASGSVNSSATQTVAKTISTATQMKNFASRVNNQLITFENDTITQTADIDLSTVCSATLGSWKPIGDFYSDSSLIFSGTYNGNGNSIDNLYIQDTCIWQGLFGRNNGNINKCYLNNVNITVNGRVGGIAGYNTVNATITGCHVSGTITTTVSESRSGGIAGTNCGTVSKCSNSATMKATNSASNHTGGIVGFNGLESSTATGIVESCYNTGSITGVNYVAGIVGMNYKGSINNCYNTAAITGTKCVGGILGQEYNNNGTITNSYNIGSISGTTYVGGVIGYISASTTPTISNNYYLQGIATGGINGTDTTGIAEVKTAANMKTASFVSTLGSTNWKINGSNSGYPVLSWQD